MIEVYALKLHYLFYLMYIVNTVFLLVINAVYDFMYYITSIIGLDLFSTVYPSHFEQDILQNIWYVIPRIPHYE